MKDKRENCTGIYRLSFYILILVFSSLHNANICHCMGKIYPYLMIVQESNTWSRIQKAVEPEGNDFTCHRKRIIFIKAK